MTNSKSTADAKSDQTHRQGSKVTHVAENQIIHGGAPQTRLADRILEEAAESLTRTAINKALAGDASALRHCLNRLEMLDKDRHLSFIVPEINGPEDLPKATHALLQAVAASEVNPAEAMALAKIIDLHMRAIELVNVENRLRHYENIENYEG